MKNITLYILFRLHEFDSGHSPLGLTKGPECHIDAFFFKRKSKQVSVEVADVSSHLQQKWDRGSKFILAVLVFLFAPIGKIWEKLIDYLMKTPLITKEASPWLNISVFCGILIACLFLIGLSWPFLNRYIHGLFRRSKRLVAEFARF